MSIAQRETQEQAAATHRAEAVELFHADGKPAGIFYCSRCRGVGKTREETTRHCCDRKCSLCGGRLDPEKERGMSCHPACWYAKQAEKEAARRVKAEVLTEWDGWIYCEGWGNDGCLSSLGELLDEIEDDCDQKPRPDYAWVCKENPFRKLDAYECFELVTEDSFDGALDQLSGTADFIRAVDAFNAANAGLVSYSPDFTRVVLVPLAGGGAQ